MIIITGLIITGCSSTNNTKKDKFNFISNSDLDSSTCTFSNMSKKEKLKKVEEISKEKNLEIATFAGGCFWCIESDFEKINGVIAISGYTGGETENPTYKEVSSGNTGHYEAVEIYYDPQIISYKELLDIFFKHIDPTDPNGQFADRGSQYRPAIFYNNENQKMISQIYITALKESKIFEKEITVEIKKATNFYLAEDYHQDYSSKNKIHYNIYRNASGRNDFIEETWKEKKNVNILDENLKEKLSEIEYNVAIEGGTEKAFNNKYWNNYKEGIYVDIITGEPLFSSKDKYDSKTGWPAFTKPIDKKEVVKEEDLSYAMKRIEVKSTTGTHLGHVFNDGPKESGGLRYCINSASLRFIPKKELEKAGYAKYLEDFK